MTNESIELLILAFCLVLLIFIGLRLDKISYRVHQTDTKLEEILTKKDDIKNVWLDGHYVYVFTNLGLHSYDISDPEHIKESDFFRIYQPGVD